MTLPAPAQVFIGGALGGAVRIGIDHVVPAGSLGIPWDILVINVVGSFLLGTLAAMSLKRGSHPYFPFAGPGLMGGFTTFSAISTLHWTTSVSAWQSAVILAASMAVATAAAALGWVLASRSERGAT